MEGFAKIKVYPANQSIIYSTNILTTRSLAALHPGLLQGWVGGNGGQKQKGGRQGGGQAPPPPPPPPPLVHRSGLLRANAALRPPPTLVLLPGRTQQANPAYSRGTRQLLENLTRTWRLPSCSVSGGGSCTAHARVTAASQCHGGQPRGRQPRGWATRRASCCASCRRACTSPAQPLCCKIAPPPAPCCPVQATKGGGTSTRSGLASTAPQVLLPALRAACAAASAAVPSMPAVHAVHPSCSSFTP